MGQQADATSLDIVVKYDGEQPSLIVRGNIDSSNINNLVSLLRQLVQEYESCISIDLAGVGAVDVSAIEVLAEGVILLGGMSKRLHLRGASRSVRSIFDKLMLSDLVCMECNYGTDLCPRICSKSSSEWELDVFTLPSSLSFCSVARERVRRVADAVGFDRKCREDILLAVGEAVSNAIKYGKCEEDDPSFTVSCLGTREKVCVTVSDSGPGFSLTEDVPSFEDALFMEHGRGIHCMNAVMDDVVFKFGGGTTVQLVKRAH